MIASRILLLHVFLAISSSTLCCAHHAQATVTLNITLQTPSGDPIVDAPMEAASSIDTGFAMTDATGEATFVLDIAEGESVLSTRMSAGGLTPIVPPEDRELATTRFHQLRKTYSFKGYYLMSITGEIIDATVSPEESVTIDGRLVDDSGNTVTGIIGVRGRIAYDYVDEVDAGAFSVPGVPRGVAAALWYSSDKQLHRLELTANQTEGDTDIGDVLLVDTVSDGSATIVMDNTADLSQPNKTRLDRALSLVAIDDAEPHIFDVKSDGRAYWTDDNSNPVYTLPLPAGTYYVTPGSYGDRSFFALYESVKAGRQPELDAAGVPKITIVAGETAEFTFDAQAALDAIIDVGGDLVDE